MPSAHVNGIDIHFQHGGTGRRLLFLNGSGATLASSGLLLGPFEKRFELLTHDQRGLGETTIPPGPYTMADYASDAAGLLDHVGWDTCRVAGISFGGMVAQELAVTQPERIERLVLLCTSPGGPGGASYPLHELADLPADERAEIGRAILDTRFTPAWLAEHEGDRMVAEVMAARGAVERTPDQQRGEAAQLRGAPPSRCVGSAASDHLSHAGGQRSLRRHRSSVERRGHREPDPGCRAAPLRRRAHVLRAGPLRPPGCHRLPRRVSSLTQRPPGGRSAASARSRTPCSAQSGRAL